MMDQNQISTFYKFKQMPDGQELRKIRHRLRLSMSELSIKGTIILAAEGINATVAGSPCNIEALVDEIQQLLNVTLEPQISFHEGSPFHRVDVKIRPEIVSLKRDVDMSLGENTHLEPAKWNEVISDPQTLVLDARNDYEFRSGTFQRAVNPGTSKFSELPDFVSSNFDPAEHKRIAMFCTGGVRCEKFIPYMKHLGYEEVYQLKGGILKYLNDVKAEESLWQGECFVFDDRITVDDQLKKGRTADLSQSVAQPANSSRNE